MNFIWPFILGVAFGWFMAACFHIWYYEDHLSYKPPAAITTYIPTYSDDSGEFIPPLPSKDEERKRGMSLKKRETL